MPDQDYSQHGRCRVNFNTVKFVPCTLQDLDVYQELFDPLPKLVSPVDQDQPDSGDELHKLERQVSQAMTSQEVVTAVERLFKATPPSKHRSIVLQVHTVDCGFCSSVELSHHLNLIHIQLLKG